MVKDGWEEKRRGGGNRREKEGKNAVGVMEGRGREKKGTKLNMF